MWQRNNRSIAPGAFKLESRGIVLFEKIDSDDHTAITGLPLLALVAILSELGLDSVKDASRRRATFAHLTKRGRGLQSV